MTALLYALSRVYHAFLEARMKQALVEIKRHQFLQ